MYYDEYKSTDEAKLQNVMLLPFIERMDLAYAAADLVVCRAGALTISELCLAAKPAILVPSPNVAEDHQTKNAKSLADKGAARLLKDKDVFTELGDAISSLINDNKKLDEMKKQLGLLAKPDAARIIADEVIKVASTNM